MATENLLVTPNWLTQVVDLDRVSGSKPPFLFADSENSAEQHQTQETFSFKWSQNASFERKEFRDNSGNWYREKYGPLTEAAWWKAREGRPVVIEIGPGAGVSAEYLLRGYLPDVDYLGVDISTAIYEADSCLRGLGGSPWFLRADILKAPLKAMCADLVFSEGVLHHTDNTRQAVHVAAGLVKPGGRLAFYVYKKKAASREFTDDHIRFLLKDMSPTEAWQSLEPLTKLGQALGELETQITVSQDVDLLGIPAGTYDIQRFVYWFFCKMYYRPEFTLDEMNHINFDWFTPENCFRHSEEEVRGWIDELGFDLSWIRVEEAGITVVADRPL